MDFNENIKQIFNIFKNNNCQIYLVGGCVRDIIMGLEPHDYDFTTNATPNQMKEIAELNSIEIIPTGEQYGTMTFRVNNTNYEVTTFRADGNYSDGRRPDQVKFSNSLEEDLKRRDFTINALAMDSEGNIIDLFDGQEDIENHIIRAIGDPDERFQEDALRIMRAIRFAYRYKFIIDFATENALIGNIKNLKNVSQERIDDELLKILSYKGFIGAPDYVLEKILSYLFIYNPNYEKINLGSLPLNYVMNYRNVNIKLSYFALKYANGDAKTFYQKNKFSNKLREEIQDIIDNYIRIISEDDKYYCIRKCLSETNEKAVEEAIEFYEDIGHSNPIKYEFLKIWDEIIKNHDPISLKDLAINGNDLIKLGYKGKEIGEILNELLEVVLHSPEYNNYYDLLRILTTK